MKLKAIRVEVCHGDGLATLRMGDRERHVEAAHLRELAYDMLEAAALLSSPESDSPKSLTQEIIDRESLAVLEELTRRGGKVETVHIPAGSTIGKGGAS